MSKHDDLVRRIRDTPAIAGVKNVIESHMEYPIIGRQGQLLTEVDLWILNNYACHIFEMKTHDGEKPRHKAVKQLKIGKKGLQKEFGFKEFRSLYVHDDFVVEELKEDDTFSPIEILCQGHFLGMSKNQYAIGNTCYGCTPDYNAWNNPCNYDCDNFNPIRWHSFNVVPKKVSGVPSFESDCPICEKRTHWDYIGDQETGIPGQSLHLFDCEECGGTHSIGSLMKYRLHLRGE